MVGLKGYVSSVTKKKEDFNAMDLEDLAIDNYRLSNYANSMTIYLMSLKRLRSHHSEHMCIA